MALQRRPPLLLTLFCSSVMLLLLNGPAAAGETGQLTVFWGRNKDEGSLQETCDAGLYTTVAISFFSVFGHGKYWTDLSGNPVVRVGADIKHCQSKGILVLLSIGGEGDQYSLPTAKSAHDVADHLWNAYLGGGRRGVFRPFGDAVLDGVDFYVNQGGWEHYDELARRLQSFVRRGGKAVSLTASPVCSLALMDDERTMRKLEVFERLHVRFYNESSCDYNYFETRPFWGAWITWSSRFPKARVYVGWPASEEMSGFVDPQTIRQSVRWSVQDVANYGGVMIWERYYDKMTGFGRAIKDIV